MTRAELADIRDAVHRAKADFTIALDRISDAIEAAALEKVRTDELLTPKQAAERAGVSKTVFNAYVSRQDIVPVRLPSGRGTRPIYRFRASDIDAFLRVA